MCWLSPPQGAFRALVSWNKKAGIALREGEQASDTLDSNTQHAA